MSSDGFVSLQDRLFLDSLELKQPAMSTVSGNSSEPKVPPDSPGSSVSSRLQVVKSEIIHEKNEYKHADSCFRVLHVTSYNVDCIDSRAEKFHLGWPSRAIRLGGLLPVGTSA